MLALYILALVAEIAGLVLAADGLRRTWHDFRRPDDEFMQPLTARARTARRWTSAQLQRLIRRPVAPVTVRPDGIGVTVTMGTPSVTATGWAVPPADDTVAYFEYLTGRLDHLAEQMQQVRTQVEVAKNADLERHAEATAAIGEIRNELDRQMRTITIGGLREQAVGWLLIVIGTILGGLGNILSLN